MISMWDKMYQLFVLYLVWFIVGHVFSQSIIIAIKKVQQEALLLQRKCKTLCAL